MPTLVTRLALLNPAIRELATVIKILPCMSMAHIVFLQSPHIKYVRR